MADGASGMPPGPPGTEARIVGSLLHPAAAHFITWPPTRSSTGKPPPPWVSWYSTPQLSQYTFVSSAAIAIGFSCPVASTPAGSVAHPPSWQAPPRQSCPFEPQWWGSSCADVYGGARYAQAASAAEDDSGSDLAPSFEPPPPPAPPLPPVLASAVAPVIEEPPGLTPAASSPLPAEASVAAPVTALPAQPAPIQIATTPMPPGFQGTFIGAALGGTVALARTHRETQSKQKAP